MAKDITNKEFKDIYESLNSFLKETETPYSNIEPWDIIDKYFIVDNEAYESPIIDLKVGNKLYSLGAHSTLDVTDAKNFIAYMRVLCRNLLIGPIKI